MIRFRPTAARELADIVRYYAAQYPGRGDRFVNALDDALLRIAEAPQGFPLLRPPDIRSAKVARFPYRVVFIVLGGDVDVLAVAHAKRRPGYWRGKRT